METIQIRLTANNAEDLIMRITAELHKRGFSIKTLFFESLSADMASIGVTVVGESSKQAQILRQLSRLYDIQSADLIAC